MSQSVSGLTVQYYTGLQSPASQTNGHGCLLQNLFASGLLLSVHRLSDTATSDLDLTSTHWTSRNFSPLPQDLEH